jgi:hypothetical protein
MGPLIRILYGRPDFGRFLKIWVIDLSKGSIEFEAPVDAAIARTL